MKTSLHFLRRTTLSCAALAALAACSPGTEFPDATADADRLVASSDTSEGGDALAQEILRDATTARNDDRLGALAVPAAAPRAPARELVRNGSFESPVVQPRLGRAYEAWQHFGNTSAAEWHPGETPAGSLEHLQGWLPLDPAGHVELQRGYYSATWGRPDVPAPDGSQHVEVEQAGIYQVLDTEPGSIIEWKLSHAGRFQADTAKVVLESADGTSGRQEATLTSGPFTWTRHSGRYTVPAGQHKTRIAIVPVAHASEGTWIDAVSVTTILPAPVPVPQDQEFPLPPPRTASTVGVIAPSECPGATNGFFPMPAPDPAVEARRRYVAEQFLAVDASGQFDPQATFERWDREPSLNRHFHTFGLVGLMFNQAALARNPATRDAWIRHANALARKSVNNPQYEPFQRYQMMDTFMRWRCMIEPSTEAAIRADMTSRPFGGRYGTANLKILNAYTRYMTGLAWPDARIQAMQANDPDGSRMLLSEARDLYKYTSAEWASQPYDGYNTFVFMSLAQLSPDRTLANAANLGFQAAMAKTASVWMRGILSTYSLRDYPPFKSGAGGAFASHWYWLGGKIPSASLSRSYLVGAAVNYHLPREIIRIANATDGVLDTRLTLSPGGFRVHSQSYIRDRYGVYSNRSATRDGTGSTFVPGQTTPPGVVWSPAQGRANFWLTLTEDPNLLDAGKGWTNSTTNLIHAKRGQQWLQHRDTLLMVTDNVEGQIPEREAALHQIIGSMPPPNADSLVDTSCATTACKLGEDGMPVYQLFYARDARVLIALSSSKPFRMLSQRTARDWQNAHGFTIPLSHAESLANGVAIEAEAYDRVVGDTVQEKLANWKAQIVSSTKYRFTPPSSPVQRASLAYVDRHGHSLYKEYIWSGNAPFWRTQGWGSARNPDPDKRALEVVDGQPVDHTRWPSIENRLVRQDRVNGVACPLYVRSMDGKAWVPIWNAQLPVVDTPRGCPVPN